MNSINQITEKNTKQKNFWSRFAYPVALISLLSLGNINDIQAQSNESNNRIDTELSAGELIPQLDKKLGVTLPSLYDSKIRNFLDTNFVMSDKYVRKFTEDFISEQMESNRGVSKQNQLIFIRDAIYSLVIGNDLYDGEDGDSKRLQEYEVSIDLSEHIGEIYEERLTTYIGKITEETRQRTEETRQRTEESIRHIMALDSAGLKSLNNIYDLYKKDPSSVTEGELEQAKKSAAHIISDCKRYGIDYKKLLSPEVRRFYGIE